MAIRRFELPTILPGLSAVLGRLGYNPKLTVLDESILESVKNEIQKASSMIHPVGNSIDEGIKLFSETAVRTESGLIFESAKLAKILEKSKKITLMVCTIGNELKEFFMELSSKDEMSRAVILDAVASEAVEAFADYINEVIAREYSILRLRPTMRFSPGYGDLTTNIHKKFLPMLDSESIGISYNPENYILYPEKSISAIIGWQ